MSKRATVLVVDDENRSLETLDRMLSDDFDISALITGEAGTGKELLSRAIHYGSARAGIHASSSSR